MTVLVASDSLRSHRFKNLCHPGGMLNNGDTVGPLIESREGECSCRARVFTDSRKTKRLRGSVALPATDNPSAVG